MDRLQKGHFWLSPAFRDRPLWITLVGWQSMALAGAGSSAWMRWRLAQRWPGEDVRGTLAAGAVGQAGNSKDVWPAPSARVL